MKKLLTIFIGFLSVIFHILAPASYAGTKEDIKAACPNGVHDQDTLMKKVLLKTNSSKDGEWESYTYRTVNTEGKCYTISDAANGSAFVYMVDDTHYVYRVRTGAESYCLLLIDFTNIAKDLRRSFNGIVKGVGSVEYKDGEGVPRTMPHMILIHERR
jgi:hypothetical protein